MDVAVIERARHGDEAAFAEIYEYYNAPIHRYAYRLLGNPEQADDLTQETFIRAYQSLDRLEDDPNLSAWLYRIASNACMDALRRRRRITWLPMREKAERDPQFTTEDFAPQVVEAEAVRRVLAEMPVALSMTLVLRSSEGFSCEEIAEIMNVPKGTVFSRLARAREQFTKRYAGSGREEKG
ncbi:MAG TPA: sigma-70 family RNA polymerase sigma factor [Chloroflexia bacterium]|nr:sigma-70 family RNA polymerase sigma factor [Chloroflexia bacterium]